MARSHKRSRNERRRRQAGKAPKATAPPASAEASGTAEAAKSPTGGQRITRWWEANPTWLQEEQDALDRAGIEWERLQPDEGVLALRLKVDVGGELYSLIAIFPDSYPYFRPEVFAPELDLGHHQNPFSKALCLIGRSTEHWDYQLLADYVTERLPLTLAAAKSSETEEAAALEEHQGEPFTDYYTYEPSSALVVDSAWPTLQPGSYGSMTIGLSSTEPFRGAVLEIKDKDGRVLASADERLVALFEGRLFGLWACLGEPIRLHDPSEILRFVHEQQAGVATPRFGRVSNIAGRTFAVTAAVFPEEVAWRERAQGWLFVGMRRTGYRGQITSCLVRPYRAGPVDVRARAPELEQLRPLTVAIAGVGAIGAPLALELARAGVGHLHILDHDLADPATAVRWPFGVESAGIPKVHVLESFVRHNYPYSTVETFVHRIGAPDTARDEPSIMNAFLDGADVVVDATAEYGVGYYLSSRARELGIPYVSVTTTFGAWGGMIVRIRPGKSAGCWTCLQHHLLDKTIAGPPFDPEGTIQPVGCADPTFRGAGFDVSFVALGGVRTVVQTLLSGSSAGCPDYDWDVAVLSLRDANGAAIYPTWQVSVLDQHPSCSICNE
jgi:molybdopterin/thiamine biosynthesis adenylyltransferase